MCGARVLSHVVGLGTVEVPAGTVPGPDDQDRVDADPVRCADAVTAKAMVDEIDAARKDGDTLGGVVEVVVHGLPPGLGSHVHGDRRLDARLAGALMGIQAIKGVEVGDGFALARTRGLGGARRDGARAGRGVRRTSGRSGGTEGGMSTGEVLRVRAAMKPISTVPRALRTVDVRTGEAAAAHHQRSDVCAVPAAGVVAEAMVALVLADAVLEKFGGDAVAETRRNVEGYLADLAARPPHSHPGGVRDGPRRAGRSAGCRQDHGAGLLAARLGVDVRDTDVDIEAGAGPGGRRDLRRPRRGALPRARARRRRPGGRPSTTACSRSAAARCSTRAPATLLAGPARSCSSTWAWPRRPSPGRPGPRRVRCCSATSARGSRRCSTSGARSTRGGGRDGADRRPTARPGRRGVAGDAAAPRTAARGHAMAS